MANDQKNNTNGGRQGTPHQQSPPISFLKALTSKPGGAFAFRTKGSTSNGNTSHDINGNSSPLHPIRPINTNIDPALPGLTFVHTSSNDWPHIANSPSLSHQANPGREYDMTGQAASPPFPTVAYDGPTSHNFTSGNNLKSMFGTSQDQYPYGYYGESSPSASSPSSKPQYKNALTIPEIYVEDPDGGLRIVQMETPESFAKGNKDTTNRRGTRGRQNPANGVKKNRTPPPEKKTQLAATLAQIDPAVLKSWLQVPNGSLPVATKGKNPFRATKAVTPMKSQAQRNDGPTTSTIGQAFSSATFQNQPSHFTADVPAEYRRYYPSLYDSGSSMLGSDIYKPTSVMSPVPIQRLGVETVLPEQRASPLTRTPPRTETTNSNVYRSTSEKHSLLFGGEKLPPPSPGCSPTQAYNFQQWGGALSPQTATSCSSIYRATPSPGTAVTNEVVELVCFTPPLYAGIDGYGPYSVELTPIGGNGHHVPQPSELIIPQQDLDLTYVYRPAVWYSFAKDILKRHVPPCVDCDTHDQARKSQQISLPADTQVNYVDRYQWNNVMVQVYAITASYKTVTTLDDKGEPCVLKPYSGCAVIWGPDIKTGPTSACFPLLKEDDAGVALLKAVKVALGGVMDWKEMGYKQVTVLTDDERLWSLVMHHGRLEMIGGREGQVLRELWGLIVEMEKVGGVKVRFWKVDGEDLKAVSGLAEMALLPKSAVKDWVKIFGDEEYEVDGDRWQWRRGDGGWENLGKKVQPVIGTIEPVPVVEDVVMGEDREKKVKKNKGKGREVTRNFYYHSNETLAASLEERWGPPKDDRPSMSLDVATCSSNDLYLNAVTSNSTPLDGTPSYGTSLNGISSHSSPSNGNGALKAQKSSGMPTTSGWTPLNGTRSTASNGVLKPWVGSVMRDEREDSFLGRLRKQVGKDILGEGKSNGNDMNSRHGLL
ncbi:hypothetical protein AA313_de0208518 [Arthrobotrys entomopaga]|nr:hypothetical protein AA313_de0208518 [Arthrobotrys entomopaga]